MKVKLFLVDDHKIMREGIANILEEHEDCELVGQANNGKEALIKLEELQPDIVLTDIHMEPVNGIELIRELKERDETIKCIVLTMVKDAQTVKKALESGAWGYILKDGGKQDMFEAIKSVSNGATYYCNEIGHMVLEQMSKIRLDKKEEELVQLSEREMEVYELILRQMSNKEIADILNISVRTVETHKYNLLEKTGSKNVVGLAIYAMEHELFDLQ